MLTRLAIALAAVASLAVSPGARGQDTEFPLWPEGAFAPRESRLSAGVGEGKAGLEPNVLDVAQVGTFTLTYTVGKSGIAEQGGLLVDFPKSWFTNPVPLRKPVQMKDAQAPHFIHVRCSRGETKFDVSLEKLNFDNKHERFRNIIHIEVRWGSLREGDFIWVIFANTTAPYIAGRGEVPVAVDAQGGGAFKLIEKGAPYTVHPGTAAHLRLFAPSQAVVGERVELQVTAFDNYWNNARAFVGAIIVSGLDGGDIPLRFIRKNSGRLTFPWTPGKEGYYFPQVVDGDSMSPGGPIRVYDREPETKIYWGDLHSHSRISKDAIGENDFGYARGVTRLDFFASTEHDISDNSHDGITPVEWKFIRDQVRRYNEPGRFVTFLAYEASLGKGHHNVFYRSLDGAPWPSYRLRTVDAIWAKLNAGEAISIPHHLGIRWGLYRGPLTGPGLQEVKTGNAAYPGGPQLDWTKTHDQTLRPVLEIYSKHGTSEYYDPDDGLAYEQVRYTGATSVDGPHYARDAWAAGLPMGVVAASDTHVSQPGLPHTGLTAVFAEELTRDAIFEGLRGRRSYGTTGERIILRFSIAGVAMGQEGKATGPVTGKVFIAAPRDLLYAEVLAYDGEAKEWAVVRRWDEPGHLLEESFRTSVDEKGTIYYLRAELEGLTAMRLSRAWSSPVWLGP